jgi:transketolase
MVVLSPSDPEEMLHAVRAMLQHQGPVYMRTGRSPAARVPGLSGAFEIGRGVILRDGADVSIIACGVEVARALEAAAALADQNIDARVVAMSTVKPVDRDLLARCARETGCLVVAEDHNTHGGLGSAVAESIAGTHPVPIEFVGVADVFGESGEPDELAAKYGIDAAAIVGAGIRARSRRCQS